jgi:molybdenum cofactor biosynthesis enzyme MoaA
MVINFLYCVDFPVVSTRTIPSNKIEGWLLCSHRIINLQVPELYKSKYTIKYGLPRHDVAEYFRGFPGNDESGYIISAINEPLDLQKELILEVDIFGGETKKLCIALDLYAENIQEISFDDEQKKNDERANETERKFVETLERHPWITVRMDITNKCNLRCIMCHYKEKEIYSKPTKNITANQLKHYLQNIAPYVKHIMLSCGFEPLMSKHFAEIVSMIHGNFPHMEIGLCTNGMLLDSRARKVIIENNVTHVILSLDGATKQTLEKIRVGADYGRIIGNIIALRDLRTKYKKTFPVMFMDFVLMNSNIHEAPDFVQLCAVLGIDNIDFRHLVGNIFFSEHDEMLGNNQEKYNHYRKLIIAEGKKYNINVRLPEPFDTSETWTPERFHHMILQISILFNRIFRQNTLLTTKKKLAITEQMLILLFFRMPRVCGLSTRS